MPERNEETAVGRRRKRSRVLSQTNSVSFVGRERTGRTGSLEQRTVVRKTCGKSINGWRGANVPQRKHRAITLKQRQLCVEKLRTQLFYARYCRSCRPSGKETGSRGCGVDGGVGSEE